MADTLVIESVPDVMPRLAPDPSLQVTAHERGQYSVPSQAGGSQAVSEAERRRMLEEVERQQQDFGIQDVK